MTPIHVYHDGAAERIAGVVSARAPDRSVVRIASRAELADRIGEIEVLFAALPPRDGWARAQELRLIQLMGAGADHFLPADGLPERVEVAGMRGVMAPEVSEHAILMMLALARGVPTLVERQRTRTWQQYASPTLDGATLVVVGLGSIGARVARIARAMGMRVCGVRRTGAPVEGVERVVPPSDLAELLERADYLVVSAPLTAETRGWIDASMLARLPARARVICVGRGGVVDERALLAALQGGAIAGAALDVFDVEPLPPEHPLWSAPNTIVTPHLAGVGLRYVERAVEALIENVERLERGAPRSGLLDRQLGY
ncbi:MAG: D-2-hydroxyacid dehydrogenase [Sandaracinaceae bacterium]